MRWLVTLVLLSSCSVAMHKAPRTDPGTRPVDCSTSGVYSNVDAVVAGLSAIGAAMLLGKGLGPGADIEESIRLVPLGAGFAVLTFAFGWSALRANDSAKRCERFNEPLRSPVASVPATTREHAWTLTKQAASAARSGDCEAVRGLDSSVRALDAEFHASVFMRDAAIARCVQR